MSKYYINVAIEDGRLFDPILVKRSLFSRKKYVLRHSNKLLNAMNNNEIPYITSSNGKVALINDINVITEYSPRSKNIIKKNNVQKVFATTALVATIGLAAIAGNNKGHAEQSIDVTKYEHHVDDLNNSNEIIEENITNIENNNDVIVASMPLEEEKNEIYANNEIKQEASIKTEEKEEVKNPYVFSFNFKDRSNDFKDQIQSEYGDAININAEKYGMDANLITAIICQENPTKIRNDSDVGGYGIMAIEAINNGATYSAYNFLSNEVDSIVVDTERCKDDDNYSIQVGTMILNYCYNYVKNKNTDNKYSNEDEIILSLFAYNKGIGTIGRAMNNNNALEGCIKEIKSQNLGDDEYLEHVLSRMKDGSTIIFKDKTGNETSITIDNESVDEYKKNSL